MCKDTGDYQTWWTLLHHRFYWKEMSYTVRDNCSRFQIDLTASTQISTFSPSGTYEERSSHTCQHTLMCLAIFYEDMWIQIRCSEISMLYYFTSKNDD